jgi:hypothetical protein
VAQPGPASRPWWIQGLFAFCVFMTFAYMPYDFFWKALTQPIESAQEVWLGFLLTGWAAKATEPLHWAIYAAGAYGFWKMRPWLHPWAALYCGSIALGMLIWGARDERPNALYVGLAGFVPFALLTVALWRARSRFAGRAAKSELHVD